MREGWITLNMVSDLCLYTYYFLLYLGVKTLYLVYKSEIDWEVLNKNCKLDFGRNIIDHDKFDVAKKKAFMMKGCEVELCQKSKKVQKTFNSKENRKDKTSLFLSCVADLNFVTTRISIGGSSTNEYSVEANSTYHITEYNRGSIKFGEHLEPTAEFINVVNDAIRSRDIEKFKEINMDYGVFIPSEVTLGGRAYFEETNSSVNLTNEKKKEIAIDNVIWSVR